MRALLALLLALVPTVATGAPPAVGTSYHFVDPVFREVVICDTLAELQEIAQAKAPEMIFAAYSASTNKNNEPACAAGIATGLVVDVKSIGRMQRSGKYFNAYAVETQISGQTLFALYLEPFEMVAA
jgi:hypothetical protein